MVTSYNDAYLIGLDLGECEMSNEQDALPNGNVDTQKEKQRAIYGWKLKELSLCIRVALLDQLDAWKKTHSL